MQATHPTAVIKSEYLLAKATRPQIVMKSKPHYMVDIERHNFDACVAGLPAKITIEGATGAWYLSEICDDDGCVIYVNQNGFLYYPICFYPEA